MKTRRKFKVDHYLCNSQGYIKMRYLLNLMFQVALDQSKIAEKGLDMENLRRIAYSWNLEIEEPIKNEDELEITTFATDMKKFYAYRNFTVEREGKLIAKAYCEFLMMDLNRLRPVKMPKELAPAYGLEESIYDGRSLEYKKDFEDPKPIYIRKNDLDENKHVNNAAYLDLIREIVDVKDEDIRYLNVVYKNEIRKEREIFGESISYGKENDFKLTSKDGGKVFTYGKIIER